ncbi:response regulator receiver modulated metal dependent phosphohydrolase [Oscillochloris trichoides DG-6]|uniref:Response regulator receiver modulated metal dependent phosphohydrolase n=1 Tax=Oscillochloris trichoides DG-6 TaxID=765420 RepID=E1IHN4_9CHLR|nr:HD domain-containing phosphohydrolase [Oscillochloris trichoides]EFO79290.1 response regulator receiver modulated metal dependent phosphohydrolase [Oscillochloris trichoides DG-6]
MAGASIVVADDEPVARELIASYLARDGHQIHTATNGLECLHLAREILPDLILLDVMMPTMDGLEACQHIRSDPLLAEVPVLIISTLDDRTSRLNGINAGADDFLTKPIDSLELRVRVQSITRLNRYRKLHESRRELETAYDALQQAYDTTILGWSRALDLRDRETEGHSQRVTNMSVRMAKMLGLPESEIVHLRRGALLHDIGKLGIPDAILHKPGPLTPEEWVIMRLHPVYAYEWLAPIEYLRPALDIPYCHHEKWDGSGYPQGLAGTAIPLAARIFAFADVWDAMRSDRPYRKSMPVERVKQHIAEISGSHFDPDLTPIFLALQEEIA